MKKLIIIILPVLIVMQKGFAQYFQFSQYNYTSQRISPAAPACTDYALLSFIYRNQTTGGDQKLNSNMLSASYPLIRKKDGIRWSGIGMTFLNDKSGGIYNVSEGSISYAVNVFLRERQSFSLGVKTLYQQRKIDATGLHTGLQYVQDRGFDGAANSGEPFGVTRKGLFSLSTGLSWQNLDRNGIRNAYMSLSLFDFNRPRDSFLNAHRLNSTVVAGGGFRLYKISNLSVLPEVLYTRSAANNVLNVGLITRCDVKATQNQKAFYVDFISKIIIHRSVILGLQFQGENFSCGFSYDFPVQKNNVGNLGAFEIGLEFRNLVRPKLAKKTAKGNMLPSVNKQNQIKTASKQPSATPKILKDPNQQKGSLKKDLTSVLLAKRDSLMHNAVTDSANLAPLILDRVSLYFNFKFNSSDLDLASTGYLDELATALKNDKGFKIKLTGHTDNAGNADANVELSIQRANAVRDYLISHGVHRSRIEANGKGMSEPLNENKTEEDRAKNRRVELTIIYKE